MYLEFIILIFDYFRTVNKKNFIYEWLIPFGLSIAIFYLLYTGENTKSFNDFRSSLLSLLGILIGFSITIITILTTSHSRNLEEIKEKKTEVSVSGKKISLYQLILINFSYSVVVEVILVLIALIAPTITGNMQVSLIVKYFGFVFLIFSVTHVLLLTIRNLTDFYFILIKPSCQ